MEQALRQSAELLPSSPYAIEVEKVCFSYEKTEVLKEVSFRLKQGEFLGIIGPNGGGKTTLVRLMLGLLRPDRGTIRILGMEPNAASRRVGYVPQSMDLSRAFPISVMEVALMGRLSRSGIGKRYTREDREKARQALEKAGMWEHRHKHIGKLSGARSRECLLRGPWPQTLKFCSWMSRRQAWTRNSTSIYMIFCRSSTNRSPLS